ncbi:hypothetical protein FRB99_000877 [Tulasnella sp. 403]|nr:hypothetical protein FRB99_000877 [Tulasnella sp. 403]
MDLNDVQRARLAMHKKRATATVKRDGCATLYLAPTAGAQVDSSKPMTISWDNSCFQPAPSTVDIYMTAPSSTNPQIYTWYNVDYHAGTLNVDLKPKWWNSTSTIPLQLNIVQSGTPSFLTQFPAGPVFSATYDPSTAQTDSAAAAAANTNVPDSPYTSVNNLYHGGGLTKGQLAAAVLLPLLFIFTGVAVYVVIARKKEKEKRQRWSQAVDKRMSTISTDWKSMSGAAANHAIRQSMALSGGDRNTKASSFFAGSGPVLGRPSSTFTDPGQAGIGTRYGNSSESEMVQIPRPPGTATSATARISRVSFAADVHPRHSMGDSLRTSVYTTGTGPTRAFHRSTVYGEGNDEVPPLPNTKSGDDSGEMQLSPTQTYGPSPLTPSEIRAKIAAADDSRPSLDEGLLKMPAMTLMRTSEASPELVIKPTPPVNPTPILNKPSKASLAASDSPSTATAKTTPSVPSTFEGLTPIHAAGTSNTMSPDDMLKAYAAAKKANPTTMKRTTVGNTESANGGMRTLYAPHSATSNVPPVPMSNQGPYDAQDSPYDEDSYSYGYSSYYGGTGHGHTDSYGTAEEGIVSYGHLARASMANELDVGSNNPFRKSMKVASMYVDDGVPRQAEAK